MIGVALQLAVYAGFANHREESKRRAAVGVTRPGAALIGFASR
jgi:hypothetical protein